MRAHFNRTATDPLDAWVLEPGDVVRRRAIHETYGGQQQGGISTPRSIPEIFIFTDPEAGAKFGYDQFEGLREDGSYSYTGEGQYGPQIFVRGNKALRDAATDGKIIRLLRTKGVSATYVGSFTTGTPTYAIETIPDADGNPRDGIIFNLIPIDARVELLPAYGGELEPANGLINYAATPRTWTPPEFSDVVITESEHAQGERVVSRIEFELQADFGAWLTSTGTEPKRLPLRVGSTLIEPDLFVPERNWIVEAKRSTARGHVRTAIGQVLDYVHVAAKSGLHAIPVVLLPGLPEQDLRELMSNLGITVVTRGGNDFRVTAPTIDQS
ncbi:hypothetical protein ACWGJP_03495 [Microbacterium sp. NPDC055903]